MGTEIDVERLGLMRQNPERAIVRLLERHPVSIPSDEDEVRLVKRRWDVGRRLSVACHRKWLQSRYIGSKST